jgi:hypothetical protein
MAAGLDHHLRNPVNTGRLAAILAGNLVSLYPGPGRQPLSANGTVYLC